MVLALGQCGDKGWWKGVRLFLGKLGAPAVKEAPKPTHDGAVGITTLRFHLQHAPEVAKPLGKCGGALERHCAPRKK